MSTVDRLRARFAASDPANDARIPTDTEEKVQELVARLQSAPDARPPLRRRPALLAALTVGAAAVCAGAVIIPGMVGGGDGDKRQPEVVDAHVQVAYPLDTERDWVSYGDHVAVVHVENGSEKIGAVPEDVKNKGEGHLDRTGRIVVDEVLYNRDGAPSLPDAFTAHLGGVWWDKDSGQQEFNLKGTSRIEAGHKYIAVLVKDEDTDQYELATYGGVLPFDGGAVGVGEVEGTTRSSISATETVGEMDQKLKGKSSTDVKQVLKAADLYPAAAANPELPAGKRHEEVIKAGDQ
ncbi:hypothetical protein AB0K53_04345 [Streptomyces tuirus]|uniref:hypothetical protein n=1 Tax=Streptomyces tuirus TaxID=68278 RepID=UPI003417A5F3